MCILEDSKKEEGSLASFMACVEESIKEMIIRSWKKDLDSKVKLAMYKTLILIFGKNIKYSHGVAIGDVGRRLLFKFRTHGLKWRKWINELMKN